MTPRVKVSLMLLGVGAVAWLPLTSVGVCLGLRTLSRTNPWAVPTAAFVYWRDNGSNANVVHWLSIAAAGAALLAAAPALLALLVQPSRRLRPARPGETVPPAVRAASDAYGRADWLPMDAVRKLFPGRHPEYGGVVVGEAYRVDKDPKAHGPFKPSDPRSWGQGGKSALLIDPCTSDSTHGTVFAGSGGFKTTSVTVPTMTTWTGAAVVFDPPDQVAPMVQRVREQFGHKVWVIKPGGIAIDVLGWIDPAAPSAETDVLSVLSWLCGDLDDKAKGEGAIFAEGGRKLLACLLADMLWEPAISRGKKTLRELRRRVTVPEKRMRGLLEEIQLSSHSAVARDYAGTLMGLYSKTFSGVYFHATTETDFLAIDSYAEMLSRADFDPADICRGKTTVFISVSMKDLKATPALGRVLVGTFQAALRRAEGNVTGGRVLFLLDETRFLRRLPILADMMTADRKYGATIITMWQSQSDLEEIWGKQAGVFSANSSWTMYAAIEDDATGKLISSHCGKFTVLSRTQGTSTNSGGSANGGGSSRGFNAGTAEQARDLIRPEEVREMRPDEAIIFRRGTPPIRAGRALYFRRPEMRVLIGADRLRTPAHASAKGDAP